MSRAPSGAVGLLGGVMVALAFVFARVFTANERSVELTDQLMKHLKPILEELKVR